MPLNNRIATQPDTASLLAKAWSESTRNPVARGYMGGLIDALMWAGKLTEQEYDNAYTQYVYGKEDKEL